MAQQLGYQPEVILAGRRINDTMGAHIARRLVKLLVNADIPAKGARVGVLGVTFKENCNDIRNSKVPNIIRELRDFGIEPLLHDPIAPAHETLEEYGLTLSPFHEFRALDALVLAVSHDEYVTMGAERLQSCLREGGVLIDVKSALDPKQMVRKIHYWSL
jgi:UDP-N-acetyl-D-galactosamine dehydrogenase